MQHKQDFNPIETAKRLEDSYRTYIATTIHFDDSGLQRQLEEILARPGYLAKGPFLEAAWPYVKDKSVSELVEEGVLCRSMLSLGGGDREAFDPDRPLYVHQVRAIRKAAAGRNYAVATGTGSGKTESFLLPVLDDILAEFEQDGPTSGVRAMILYPMNALANDQLKRLRQLLEGTPVTFGRYTGDTEETERKAAPKWREENPGQERQPNEIISREEIRRNPPNILLTNYSMLEYLLLRPEDAPLFGSAFGANWRHIVIDEAHVYTGALGTEIAYLLRRLKARIASETGHAPRLRCYATSATIGSEDDMPKVARFAQDLFGEPFECEGDGIDVVTGVKSRPSDDLDEEPWGRLPLGAWKELREAVAPGGSPDGTRIASALASWGAPKEALARLEGEPPLAGLGEVLLGEESAMKLVRRCETLLDLTDLSSMASIGIEGIPSGDAAADAGVLASMVEVLSAAERSEGVPILSSRYHSFLRAPEGIFVNFDTGKLTPDKTVSEPRGDGAATPVYELSVCRHCGQAYALGEEQSAREARTAWLSPRHEGTDADDEFIPRTYYRVLADETERDADEEVQWLCPACGSLHSARTGGGHRFTHEERERIPIARNESEDRQATEDVARCRHCGYQSRVAIQPMRVSPEAAGSIVCYDLVRDVPPFDRVDGDDIYDLFAPDEGEARAGSVICFSDKRQDAAFFAPALERTYGGITRRQVIREAVEACAKARGGAGCSPTAVVNWIASEANRVHPGLLGGDKHGQAEAWVLDEMAAEDSRNSLDGLGVIRIEATAFHEGLEDPRAAKAIDTLVGRLDSEQFAWLGREDYALLAKVCLELLRERNAIAVPDGVSGLREAHEARGNWVECEADGKGSPKDTILFAGSATGPENKRSAFIRKYARKVRGAEVTREDAATLLRSLFGFTGQYLGGFFKGEGYLDGTAERFRLNKDIWTMYPHGDGDVIYRCDTCGCETHLFTGGVCTTTKCEGTMVASTFAESIGKDRHYKQVYQQEALPITIEEHTAQLSSKKAREVQASFIKGDVNVLSCTTTFELGVDVGDLRAIFMRNVPPTTANYTQRAGRVGRRAGMPGYAVTFARLRPHDVAHFEDPSRIIAGDTRAPFCYLDNPAIAKRHVFAVALSEFFRADGNADYAHFYHDFLDLSREEPPGLEELRRFLDERPHALDEQLETVVPEGLPVWRELGIGDWGWVDDLVASHKGEESGEGGRLALTHLLKHADYARVEEGIEANRGTDEFKAGNLTKTLGHLKDEKTISVLAENGVLPKYGFPTDLVELHLPEMSNSANDDRLSLQRGLRQAIREYAPGAEVVAGKTLWRSIGIRRPRGHELQVRRYGSCDECGTFIWPIENYSDTGTCPACGAEVELKRRMLVPSYGFVGKSLKKGVGVRKPRSRGYAKVQFAQHWPNEAEPFAIELPGRTVTARFAENAQLCALNETMYNVCDRCCAAAPIGSDIRHMSWCGESSSAPHTSRYNALGSPFVSDVLEVAFGHGACPEDIEDEGCAWESTMWAVFAAAAKILEVPETEIGGTYYRNGAGGTSIMVYDDVPGGAGHAKQLAGQVELLLQTAYETVADCSCGEDTCCYGCIANYYNQGRQASLSRGAAKRILGGVLGR